MQHGAATIALQSGALMPRLHNSLHQEKTVGSSEYLRPLMVLVRCVIVDSCSQGAGEESQHCSRHVGQLGLPAAVVMLICPRRQVPITHGMC